MNLSQTTTDNITEVLEKIIKFTERRNCLLMRNIEEVDDEEFIPVDLDVDDFAGLMTDAILEHIQNKRLLLCDSETIRFGRGGSFECMPIVDEQAMDLLESDPKEYICHEIRKLSENFINNKIATELLEHKKKSGAV
ncbi:MAG: hypothetical protein KAJ19_11695 [Gammaproteobacteria bacterium]|nr:hypothetical protein [Gammaproteobacteria bacterium]